MLNAWLTAHALRRRADATALTAHNASANARRHARQAVSASANWCAGTPGLLTLFGVGLAGGMATKRNADTGADATGKTTLRARTPARTSLARDLLVNTLSRLAAAVVAARLIVTAADTDTDTAE